MHTSDTQCGVSVHYLHQGCEAMIGEDIHDHLLQFCTKPFSSLNQMKFSLPAFEV